MNYVNLIDEIIDYRVSGCPIVRANETAMYDKNAQHRLEPVIEFYEIILLWVFNISKDRHSILSAWLQRILLNCT